MSATLQPEQVTAIIDTREQTPLDLAPLQTIAATLATGDYTVRGLENYIAIERKSLPDLVACCGRERARFDREIQRLLGYAVRAVVVESNWASIEMGQFRGRLKPQQVMGSCLGWIALGVPILFVDDHKSAGKCVSRLLFIAARRRWRESQLFAAGITEPQEATADKLDRLRRDQATQKPSASVSQGHAVSE